MPEIIGIGHFGISQAERWPAASDCQRLGVSEMALTRHAGVRTVIGFELSPNVCDNHCMRADYAACVVPIHPSYPRIRCLLAF